ncbi:MAG: zinc ribbon domain-containing protein [Mycobacterium sp.]|nr:zinc ribbon domain-containing protein [Mycobacterium sp.]
MTPTPGPPANAVPTAMCPRCAATVPQGAFCGSCGAELGRVRQGWLAAARLGVFAVAPRERVLVPMVTSTLFPHLPQTYRNPFRIGMFMMLGGVVVLSALRLLGPLVTLVALGVPVLFVLYLWQSSLLRDIPNHALAIAAGLGGALGASWVLVTGGLVARAYGIPIAAGFVLETVVGVGLFVSVGGALLMVVPAMVVRLLRPPVRESLDGFVIGAIGALSFAGAATTTRLAPQFVVGLIQKVPPMRLFVEAILYGVTVPLTAASVGGLIGILLWFRPGTRAGERSGRVRVALVSFGALVTAIYVATWVIEAARLPKWPQLGLHILVTMVALLAARVCIQLALLHEEPDPGTGQPVLCVRCDRVVPDMAFCPACGAATRAASRTSRRQRREAPPTRRGPDGESHVYCE